MNVNTADILTLMESDYRFKYKIEAIKSSMGNKLDSLLNDEPLIKDTSKDEKNAKENAIHIESMDDHLLNISKYLKKLTGFEEVKQEKSKFFDTDNTSMASKLANSTIFQLPKDFAKTVKTPEGIISALVGSLIGPMLPKIMPLLLKGTTFLGLIGGILQGAFDGIIGYFKADEWGVGKVNAVVSSFFAGTNSGWMGALLNAPKGIMIGASIGSVGGPLGILAGAVLGGTISGILGYIGGERLSNFFKNNIFTKFFEDIFDTINNNEYGVIEKFNRILLGAPLYDFLTTGDTAGFEKYSRATIGDKLYEMLSNPNMGVAEKLSRAIIGNDWYDYLSGSNDSILEKLGNFSLGSKLYSIITDNTLPERFSRAIIGDKLYDFLINPNLSTSEKFSKMIIGDTLYNKLNSYSPFSEPAPAKGDLNFNTEEYIKSLSSMTSKNIATLSMPSDSNIENLVKINQQVLKQNQNIIGSIENMTLTLSGDLKTLPQGIAKNIPSSKSGDTFNTSVNNKNVTQNTTSIPDYRSRYNK